MGEVWAQMAHPVVTIRKASVRIVFLTRNFGSSYEGFGSKVIITGLAAASDQFSVVRPVRVALPLVLFCVGHFLVDLYSGALGALQPVLHNAFGLNFTQAGILGGMLVCSSSVMQPVYGLLSDRWNSRLFTVLAPAMAGVFISSLGFAPGYMGLLLMVWLGGAGIASFHPQAAANATAGVERN